MDAPGRAEERGVTEGEDAAVGGHQPVAVAVGRGGHADDRAPAGRCPRCCPRRRPSRSRRCRRRRRRSGSRCSARAAEGEGVARGGWPRSPAGLVTVTLTQRACPGEGGTTTREVAVRDTMVAGAGGPEGDGGGVGQAAAGDGDGAGARDRARVGAQRRRPRDTRRRPGGRWPGSAPPACPRPVAGSYPTVAA